MTSAPATPEHSMTPQFDDVFFQQVDKQLLSDMELDNITLEDLKLEVGHQIHVCENALPLEQRTTDVAPVATTTSFTIDDLELLPSLRTLSIFLPSSTSTWDAFALAGAPTTMADVMVWTQTIYKNLHALAKENKIHLTTPFAMGEAFFTDDYDKDDLTVFLLLTSECFDEFVASAPNMTFDYLLALPANYADSVLVLPNMMATQVLGDSFVIIQPAEWPQIVLIPDSLDCPDSLTSSDYDLCGVHSIPLVTPFSPVLAPLAPTLSPPSFLLDAPPDVLLDLARKMNKVTQPPPPPPTK